MNPTVLTVVASEEPAVAERARQECSLANRLDNVFDSALRPGKIERRRVSEVGKTAVRDEVKAETTFFKTRGNGEFVAGVNAWIGERLAKKVLQGAMRLVLPVLGPAAEKIVGPAFSQSEHLQPEACRDAMGFSFSDITIPNRHDAIPGSVPAF